MKKMIMIAAILTIAATTQAANINWSAVSAMKDKNNATLNGSAVLLIQVLAGASAPTLGWSSGNLTISGGSYLGQANLGTDGKMTPAKNVTITGTWSAGTINVFGGAAFGQPGTVAATGFGNTNGRDYYMVVFDSATISQTSQFAFSTLANKYSSTDAGTLTAAFSAATGSASTWTTVPEPTAMALLALGAAAVGLRRKFVK